MASVFNFLKKHRGKIMFTGVIAGGIYAGMKCYDYFVTKDSRNNEFLFTTTIADDEETVQDNRDLNYDDFMKNDALLANDETDVPIRETLAQVMPKNGKYDERTMKMFIFKSNQKTCENTIIQLVPSLKGGIHQRNDIESLLEDLQNGVEPNKFASWEKIKGSISLMEKISCIVTDVVKILPLKENFTLSDFQQLLFEIQAKINRLNFSNFIVPLSVDGRDDDLHLFRDHNLGRMLNLLKICLENNKFKEILSQFIEEYVQSVVGFIRVNRREWKDNSEERLLKNEEEFIQKNEANLPLAKILPVLSDCFTFVSKLDTKSTFDRLLKAPCVLRYCMHIFDDYKI